MSTKSRLSKDKTRYLLTINKEFKKKLEAIAKEDDRSLNYLIIKCLEEKFNNED